MFYILFTDKYGCSNVLNIKSILQTNYSSQSQQRCSVGMLIFCWVKGNIFNWSLWERKNNSWKVKSNQKQEQEEYKKMGYQFVF